MKSKAEDHEGREPRTLSRREFVALLTAGLAGGGLAVSALRGYRLTPLQRAEAVEAVAGEIGKLPLRPLGTRMGGMKVTPVVISQDWARDLFAPGLEAGINYVHKAGYWRSLPEAFRNVPRESYYTDITVDSTPGDPDNEDSAYRQVIDSLQRSGLGYYDIFRAHFGWRSVDEMRTKRGTYRAFEKLKKEGKVKYFGVSQHNYIPYPEIIAAQIEDGLIDSMQVFFSHKTPQATQEIFAKAHQAGVGMIAMKVFAHGQRAMREDVARQQQLKAEGQIGRALIRHVLDVKDQNGKPVFDCCLSSLRNFEQFEENVGAVAPDIMAKDEFKLPA